MGWYGVLPVIPAPEIRDRESLEQAGLAKLAISVSLGFDWDTLSQWIKVEEQLSMISNIILGPCQVCAHMHMGTCMHICTQAPTHIQTHMHIHMKMEKINSWRKKLCHIYYTLWYIYIASVECSAQTKHILGPRLMIGKVIRWAERWDERFTSLVKEEPNRPSQACVKPEDFGSIWLFCHLHWGIS